METIDRPSGSPDPDLLLPAAVVADTEHGGFKVTLSVPQAPKFGTAIVVPVAAVHAIDVSPKCEINFADG